MALVHVVNQIQAEESEYRQYKSKIGLLVDVVKSIEHNTVQGRKFCILINECGHLNKQVSKLTREKFETISPISTYKL